MATSRKNNNRRPRARLRRLHRWLGISSLLFVLVLASTGIALNHSNEWRLDQRFVSWTWLLDAYGISAPAPSASFADDGHRATLLGGHLYLDGKEIAQDIDSLTGIVVLEQLVLITSNNTGIVVTREGQIVEKTELVPAPETILRIGRTGQRPVIQSTLAYYLGDEEITGFDATSKSVLGAVEWSQASPLPAREQSILQQLYRGRGVTVERVISDLHSGRIAGVAGTLLMDVVAVFLILLSLTGLAVWLMPKSRQNRTGNKIR